MKREKVIESGVVEWRPIPNWSRHEISNYGDIRSIKFIDNRGFTRNPRTLKPHRAGKYLSIVLTSKNGSEHFYIHVLVAITFISPQPPGLFCLHKDDCGTYNYVGNLYWGTRRDNVADAIRNGLIGKGTPHAEKLSKAHMGKPKPWLIGRKRTLTESHIENIRKALAKSSQLSPANKPGWIPTHRIGTKHSPETIEKMRQARIKWHKLKGFSSETKDKMRESALRRDR